MTTRHLLALPLLLLFPLSCLFSAPNKSGSDDCDAPKVSATPGCGSPPPGDVTLSSEGCYVPCTQKGAPCASGGSCKIAWIYPCVCKHGEACCDACGGEMLLCLP